MRSLYRGAMTLLVILLSALAGASSALASPEGKVYVCKYVGTPGDGETLQTGQNPIEVSINAIPDYQGVGSYFADAQGRSYVLATVPQDPEPSASDCPGGPQPSPTTTPSSQPSQQPTPEPSVTPSEEPTSSPTLSPTPSPTSQPTGSLVPPIQTHNPGLTPPATDTEDAQSQVAAGNLTPLFVVIGVLIVAGAVAYAETADARRRHRRTPTVVRQIRD